MPSHVYHLTIAVMSDSSYSMACAYVVLLNRLRPMITRRQCLAPEPLDEARGYCVENQRDSIGETA